MAIPVSGIDHRNSDNAHAWGDDDTDVWLGVNKLGQEIQLPKSSAEAAEFVKQHLPLGWLSESGVPISTEIDSTDFNAMQGSALVKTKITKTTRTFSVEALEENIRVTQLYWDHGTPKAVGAGESLVDLPNTLSTLNCWAILNFVDGEYWKIYVFPSVDITDRGELAHTNTDLSMYQMTCKIKKAGWMLTNNPEYYNATPEEERSGFATSPVEPGAEALSDPEAMA